MKKLILLYFSVFWIFTSGVCVDIWVTSDDGGTGSKTLYDAIITANNYVPGIGEDVIVRFNIPTTGDQEVIIFLEQSLPEITRPYIIDATDQKTGNEKNPVVIVDGGFEFDNGLHYNFGSGDVSDDAEVRGLHFRNFKKKGIYVQELLDASLLIEENIISEIYDETNLFAADNYGIYIDAESTVSIYGNGIGDFIESPGNYPISTPATDGTGIYIIDGNNNNIGNKDDQDKANYISFHGKYGVRVEKTSGACGNNNGYNNFIYSNIIKRISDKGIYLNMNDQSKTGNNCIKAPEVLTPLQFPGQNKCAITVNAAFGSGVTDGFVELFRTGGYGEEAYELLAQGTMVSATITFEDVPLSHYPYVATVSKDGYGTSEFGKSPEPGIIYNLSCSDCMPSFSPTPGKTYIVSAWVRESSLGASALDYTNAAIYFDFKPGGLSTIGPLKASGQIIDGWQKIEEAFTIPEAATDMDIRLKNLSATADVYFDDIRIFPKEGTMKTYVFDPITLRLVAELDENNYATYYEYDDEGSLIRVKKETERGVQTIQESVNYIKKEE